MSENPAALVRLFKIADPNMLAFARMYQLIFLEDVNAFTALNPALNEAFAGEWMDAIELAEGTPSDETVVDIQGQQTAAVLAVMGSCRRKYNQVMYFVGEAFEGNAAVHAEFGQDDYLSIRQQQDEMVTFMDNLHSTAAKYSVQLIDKGCTPANIDEINTLKSQLATENAKQQKMIRERSLATALRITRMNEVYRFCQKVNRASKQVFIDSYEKIQQYLLPGSENPVQDVAFTGTVTKQEDSTPISGATVALDTVNLTAETDEFGVFAFAQEIPDASYGFTVSAAGRATFTGNVTITDGETVNRNIALVVLS